MPVELHFGSFGKSENPPLIILHGLMGSSRNWFSAGKVLAKSFNVFALDLRNHGKSPHNDSITFEDMVEDLSAWLSNKKIDTFYIMGHSLGGKVGMLFACRNPEKIKGLVVLDIAPKEYKMRYVEEFEAMAGLDFAKISSRKDAEEALSTSIKNGAWRQFILTNLVRDKEKNFCWQVNLPVLQKFLPELLKSPLAPKESYNGPALFLRGEQSDFISDEDSKLIQQSFPRSIILKIPNAGHNVHIDNQGALVCVLVEFKERFDL